MIKMSYRWKWLWMLCSLAALCICTACQSVPIGPGMILEFGSVIEGQRVYVKSAKMSNGQPFSHPGSVGGIGTSKWGKWQFIPTAVVSSSGDDHGIPDWVEFVWQELESPGLVPADFDSEQAYSEYVRKQFSTAHIKSQRLEIKRRIPQSVVDEVIESKRKAPRGEKAEKTLWLFIFWTPEGIALRWQLLYDPGHKKRNFGDVVSEGGDDLDRYNR